MEDDFGEQLLCGVEFLTDFWQEKYFQEYIGMAAVRSNS